MTRDAAIETISGYFDAGTFQAELADLVSYETESQNPDQAPELLRYLRDAMAPRLTGMGFACTLHDNPAPGAGPILIAERLEGGDLPTILSYGHGDVIRAQTDQWREGLHPFTLVEEGDRLYGRGTADNKGQHLINIAALEAVIAARGRLGFNCRMVIETGEETGSPGLHDFFAAHKDALSADVLIASDGPRLQPETPTMFMGSRGGVTFDLGIGGGHTGDEAFQNTRHQRNAENNADEIAAAQAEHTISFGPTFEGDTGTRVEVAMPSVAKHHLKQTTRSVTGYGYDHSRQAWTVDATQASVTETIETLRDHGWAVDPPTE